MIYVIATIELQEGSRERFLKILRDNIPHVRAESGCLSYEPVVDVPSDPPVGEPFRENVVTIIESWQDDEALHRHMKTPHMNAYRKAVQHLVRGVSLRLLAPA